MEETIIRRVTSLDFATYLIHELRERERRVITRASLRVSILLRALSRKQTLSTAKQLWVSWRTENIARKYAYSLRVHRECLRLLLIHRTRTPRTRGDTKEHHHFWQYPRLSRPSRMHDATTCAHCVQLAQETTKLRHRPITRWSDRDITQIVQVLVLHAIAHSDTESDL